jgi:hypothetical protein
MTQIALMTLFAITNYHWHICWIICFIPFVRLSFSYWPSRLVIPYLQFWLRVHSGCNRSTEDAYSSAAPDPTRSSINRGSLLPHTQFCITFWILIAFDTLLTSLVCIIISKTPQSDTVIGTGYMIDWLFTVLRAAQEFSLIWRSHHYQWRAAECRPMFCTQGLWAWRGLFQAVSTMTKTLGFNGLIRRNAPFSCLLRHTRVEGLF